MKYVEAPRQLPSLPIPKSGSVVFWFSPFYLRKQLPKQLFLSKMDYGDLVFNPLPDYLVKRLQKTSFQQPALLLESM